MTVTVADIRDARAAIAGAVAVTPLVPAARLSALTGAEVWLKLETLHPTGCFKERGALNRLKALPPDAARRGVIAMSAGNHAQGVAHHATRLGIPATIVMPEFTPFSKVMRTEAFGATVVLTGASLVEARRHAQTLAQRDGLTLIHPYDDPLIVAGQGTVGLELAEQMADIDTVVIPVGGGGLAAGIAVALSALRPEIALIGVESAQFPSLDHALRGLDPPAGGHTLAEGIAVAEIGVLPLALLRDRLARVATVAEDLIERAVQLLIEEEKIVAEGAGAAPLAALLGDQAAFRGRRIVLVVGGGNVDDRILASILMRGLVRDGRMVRLRVEIPDSPGVLAKITGLIGELGGNIVEIAHQRLFHDVPVKMAEVDAVLETRNPGHAEAIVARLREAGFPTRRLGYTVETG